MFSTQYQSIWDGLEGLSRSSGELREYSAEECSALLWREGFGTGGDLDVELREQALRSRREIYDGRVFAVVPLYVSSYCAEQCVYCNYRAGNHGVGVERKRLSDEELRGEATYLIEEKGFRTIELVYASDSLMKPAVIARHVEILREVLEQHGGGIVGLSCEALDEAEYKLLADAGLSFSVLWMETYDPERYAKLHPGRLTKSRFEYRLDAYERMIAAGIPALGIGILSGLSDWRRDWAMMMHHEEYLRERFGEGARILGIPRLKRAPGAVMQGSEFIPTDAEFVATLALHKLFAKTTTPFVSTREDWETCIQIAQGGGCLFTLNCSTIPGGYSLETKGGQFANNSFDAPVFAPKLEALGFKPEFRWDVSDLAGVRADAAARA
jgi:2-iminoacetate synthase